MKEYKEIIALNIIFVLITALLAACKANIDTPIPKSDNALEHTISASPSLSPDEPPEKETIFTKDISRESKEKALEQIYKTAKENFASWNTFTFDDWKSVYPATLERVLATNNIYDFYMELKRFITLLNDDHSRVYFPDYFYDDIWVTPIRIKVFDGKYYIENGDIEILNEIPRFSEIISIDDLPVDQYMKQYVDPFNWHEKRFTLWSSATAVAGKPETFQRIQVISPLGEKRTVTVKRVPSQGLMGYLSLDNEWIETEMTIENDIESIFTSDVIKINWIDKDMLYISLPSFSNEDVLTQFEQYLYLVEQAKGIIIDIRGNSGGSSYGNEIASYFIKGPFSSVFSEISKFDENTDSYSLVEEDYQEILEGKDKYNLPIVVLQDYETGSSAEHFLNAMHYASNVLFVGTESWGGTGNGFNIDLPDGGYARISYKKFSKPDKTPFLNIGIQPDVFVENSIEDFINGYDRILDSGLKELKRMCNVY